MSEVFNTGMTKLNVDKAKWNSGNLSQGNLIINIAKTEPNALCQMLPVKEIQLQTVPKFIKMNLLCKERAQLKSYWYEHVHSSVGMNFCGKWPITNLIFTLKQKVSIPMNQSLDCKNPASSHECRMAMNNVFLKSQHVLLQKNPGCFHCSKWKKH